TPTATLTGRLIAQATMSTGQPPCAAFPSAPPPPPSGPDPPAAAPPPMGSSGRPGNIRPLPSMTPRSPGRSRSERTARRSPLPTEPPLWGEGRGWARADALVPGDVLRTNGGAAIVSGVSLPSGRTTVYNLSVEGHPTYFVGTDGGV